MFGFIKPYYRFVGVDGSQDLGVVCVANRYIVLGSVLLLSLAFIGGISVVGLLQSSERIGSSGIVVQPPPPPPPPPPAPAPPPPEPKIEIDVFADSGCTQKISSVQWGSVQAGGSVSRVVYVRNSGDYGVVLSLVASNWSPAVAEDYMSLSWDYSGGLLGSGAVAQVTLTLSVDAGVSGVSSFSFDVVIVGSAS